MFGYDWPRLHAALNDLPAALLATAVFFDLLSALSRRPSLRQAGFVTMIAGTIGAGLAVLSGLQAEDHIAHGEAVHEIMETHETLALITLGIFAVLVVWRIVRERRMSAGERTFSLLVSLAGAGVLIATGTYGGKMVFEHAAGIPSEALEQELHERAEGHHHHGGETDEHESTKEGHDSAAEEHEHDSAGEAHEHAADSVAPAGHTHPPGTPPHKD
jgi:uncharacterized membrane protein